MYGQSSLSDHKFEFTVGYFLGFLLTRDPAYKYRIIPDN